MVGGAEISANLMLTGPFVATVPKRRTLVFYIHSDIILPVKPLRFLGDSLKCLRDLPADARQDAGYQLDKIQRGKQPDDFKPMPAIGKGVEEIRIFDERGAYRVIYVARLPEAVFVIHVFQKKTRATSARDIELARDRFVQLLRDRT
jgi:phage-related protein